MENEKTEKKQIRSKFDRMAVDVLSCIVPDQKMELKDGEGNLWQSSSKDYDGAAITVITRNGIKVARIFYDYETGEENSFLY